jgi:hypothetical protein
MTLSSVYRVRNEAQATVTAQAGPASEKTEGSMRNFGQFPGTFRSLAALPKRLELLASVETEARVLKRMNIVFFDIYCQGKKLTGRQPCHDIGTQFTALEF